MVNFKAKEQQSITIAFLVAVIAISVIAVQNSIATGGSEVLKQLQPMVEEAMKSLEAGDTEKAMSQLEEVNNQLKDTYFEEEDE